MHDTIRSRRLISVSTGLIATLIVLVAAGCGPAVGGSLGTTQSVPHEERWGIYQLDLATRRTRLLYSTSNEIAALHLNTRGDMFVFAQKVGGDADQDTEICTVGVDGSGFRQLTDNAYQDAYPTWSPDGERIAFISWRAKDFDIYVMGADGQNEHRLYDSGAHDGDIHWVGNRIVFTSNHVLWTIRDDGTDPVQVTYPANVGQWDKANLPIGDYDPRFDPTGSVIAFERLVDPTTMHGSYDLFVVDADGENETRLTTTGYAQGLPSWSHSGDNLVYVVAAIGERGLYDLYMVHADGTDSADVTPKYYPDAFLCHSPEFSTDDSKVYFIGEWWGE